MSTHPWPEERVQELHRLWMVEGLSAGQCAKLLGVTRNAVIGQAHRRGWKRSAEVAAFNNAKANAGAVRAPKPPPKPRPAPRPPAVVYRPQPARVTLEPANDTPLATIATVKASQCRWPIGEPEDPAFGLCGCPAVSGPYCAAHARIAYRVPPPSPKQCDERSRELARALRRFL